MAPSHAHKPDLSGQRLGGYDILHRIASGGMGAVYVVRAARQGGFERLFAQKVCHPSLVEDPSFVEMFLDEARIAALVTHPNVVGTVDVGTDEGLPYLVMDYVEGITLSRLLREAVARKQPLEAPLVARILLDLLAGLEAIHTTTDLKGEPLHLIHRDISPQNLLLGADGIGRITDFGIAKAAARSSSSTREGVVKGKFSYMAPEALRFERCDHRADLFAVGVIAWEALSGRRLFIADSDAETMQRVLGYPIPPIEQRADMPPEVESVVLRLLDRDPQARFESAALAARAFATAFDSVASSAELAQRIDEWAGADIRSARARTRSALGGPETRSSSAVVLKRAPEAAPPPALPWGRIAAASVVVLGLALGAIALSLRGGSGDESTTPVAASLPAPAEAEAPAEPPPAAAPGGELTTVPAAPAEGPSAAADPETPPASTSERRTSRRRERSRDRAPAGPEGRREPGSFRPAEL